LPIFAVLPIEKALMPINGVMDDRQGNMGGMG
jgi:hypothetical protein